MSQIPEQNSSIPATAKTGTSSQANPASTSNTSGSPNTTASNNIQVQTSIDLSQHKGQSIEVKLLEPTLKTQVTNIEAKQLAQITVAIEIAGIKQEVALKLPAAAQQQLHTLLQQLQIQQAPGSSSQNPINAFLQSLPPTLQLQVLSNNQVQLSGLQAPKASAQQILQHVITQLTTLDNPQQPLLKQLPQLIQTLKQALNTANSQTKSQAGIGKQDGNSAANPGNSALTGNISKSSKPLMAKTENILLQSNSPAGNNPKSNAAQTPSQQSSVSHTTSNLSAKQIQPLLQQLQQLVQQLPSTEQASQPQAIKQLLQQSGIFMEQQGKHKLQNILNQLQTDSGLKNISNNNANIKLPKDLKAALLHLLKLNAETAQASQVAAAKTLSPATVSTLEQSFLDLKPQQLGHQLAHALADFIRQQLLSHKADKPPAFDKTSLDLFRLLTGALARIQINQISSHPAAAQLDPGTLNQWQFDLLLNNQNQLDNVQVLLREHYWHKKDDQEENKPNSKQRRWSAIINFDVKPYGELAIELNLQAHTLQAKIWAQDQQLYRLLDAELGWLQDALRSTGLEVESLETFNKAGPQARSKLNQQLVDIHT